MTGMTPLQAQSREYLVWNPYQRWSALYQPPYPVTVLAQVRCVIEARRSGVFISLFQAAQQASTMAP